MAKSDLIVMWGGNPVSTQVNVMTHVSRARKEHGAKFVVIDPYRTPTAAVADLHLAPRPGTDGALACAVMHIAFRDGFADDEYMARQHRFSTRSAAASFVAFTGMGGCDHRPVGRGIENFGKLYCTTKRSYIRAGYGFAQPQRCRQHARGHLLPSVTGAWQYEGGGALWSNRGMYHWNKTLIEGLDAVDTRIRALDMSRIGSVLTGDRTELGDGPQVHAMLIQNQIADGVSGFQSRPPRLFP